jgi:hypothetical protein
MRRHWTGMSRSKRKDRQSVKSAESLVELRSDSGLERGLRALAGPNEKGSLNELQPPGKNRRTSGPFSTELRPVSCVRNFYALPSASIQFPHDDPKVTEPVQKPEFMIFGKARLFASISVPSIRPENLGFWR